jgi:hypothetical protein
LKQFVLGVEDSDRIMNSALCLAQNYFQNIPEKAFNYTEDYMTGGNMYIYKNATKWLTYKLPPISTKAFYCIFMSILSRYCVFCAALVAWHSGHCIRHRNTRPGLESRQVF